MSGILSDNLGRAGGLMKAAAVISAPVANNLLINGDMRIRQRPDVSNSTTAEYCLDRWRVSLWDGSAYPQHDIAQDTTVPSGSTFTHSMKLTIDAGDASLADAAIHVIQQYVEGSVADQLRFGTADAKTVTISFWIRSPVAGVHYVSIRNNGQDRGYPAPYTIADADTFEYHSVTIPGDTSGTWLTTNGIGLRVSWCFGAGVTYQGTASTWEGGNDFAASDQVNAVATSADVIYLTGCQLEVGDSASPFFHTNYQVELAKCQRYFEPIGHEALMGTAQSASTVGYSIKHRHMRANPTLTLKDTSPNVSNGAAGFTGSGGTLSAAISDPKGTFANLTGFSGLTAGQGIHDNGTSDPFLTLDAEL